MSDGEAASDLRASRHHACICSCHRLPRGRAFQSRFFSMRTQDFARARGVFASAFSHDQTRTLCRCGIS